MKINPSKLEGFFTLGELLQTPVDVLKPLLVKGLFDFVSLGISEAHIWQNGCEPTLFQMANEENIKKKYYGDETPRGKDILIPIVVIMVIIALSWIAYFKFGWFQ